MEALRNFEDVGACLMDSSGTFCRLAYVDREGRPVVMINPGPPVVWEWAALALSANRPGFKMMIGLRRANARAALMNFLALPTPSI